MWTTTPSNANSPPADHPLNASKADSAQALIDDVTANIRSVSGELPPDDDVIMAAIRFHS